MLCVSVFISIWLEQKYHWASRISGSVFFRKHFNHPLIQEVEVGANEKEAKTQAAAFWSRKEISLKDIALNVAYTVTIVFASGLIAGVFGGVEPDSVLE